jgi:hypothetical protein
MRLTIHAGTHKTASTFLQHVLVLNQKLLAQHGIYTQPDAMMTGNHGTAWMTLLEDYRHVEAHVREAVRHGRGAALLSSEDFETLIFDPAAPGSSKRRHDRPAPPHWSGHSACVTRATISSASWRS